MRHAVMICAKLTVSSVNHRGKHSTESFRGSVFVDTIAGKLVVWLYMVACSIESVENGFQWQFLPCFIFSAPRLLKSVMCSVVSFRPSSWLPAYLSLCLYKNCTSRENLPDLHLHFYFAILSLFALFFVARQQLIELEAVKLTN